MERPGAGVHVNAPSDCKGGSGVGTMAVEVKRQNSQPESIQAWQTCW